MSSVDGNEELNVYNAEVGEPSAKAANIHDRLSRQENII